MERQNRPTAHTTASRLTPAAPTQAHHRGASNDLRNSCLASVLDPKDQQFDKVDSNGDRTRLSESDQKLACRRARQSFAEFKERVPWRMSDKERGYYFNQFVDWHRQHSTEENAPPPKRYQVPVPEPQSYATDFAISGFVGVVGVFIAALSSKVSSSAARSGMIGAGVMAIAIAVAYAVRMGVRRRNDLQAYNDYCDAQAESLTTV
ncbi:hypothetical protein BFJ63_vAg17915 [Fusarium oxysporum f. sp. narcissi]|uniref:Uncharacterized protein n=1 Tax=Fusarium oxysporum f. sp. narcissi TaxID=451672 RepID=A0A4Q2V309_FUSOX|nr:hypothetical protein BFJ63_vAg17915 [Fusarium oxysporum f. sp. narcissi]